MSDIQTEIKTQLSAISKEVKNSVAAINEEVTKHGKIGRENAENLKVINGSVEEITARVLELEQHGTSQNDIENNVKSVGAEFTDSDAFSDFAAGNSTKASFEAENNLQVGDGTTVDSDRRPGIVGGPLRSLRIIDVMDSSGTTTSNSVEYVRENIFTNAAQETEEGDFAYPESDITFDLLSAPVRNIGHVMPISKQMIEDAPLIASYINGRMTYGVAYREDAQSLVGNGVGQNLSGMMKAGNYTVLPGTASGDDEHKNIRRAIAQIAISDYNAEAVILNPIDCAGIDLIKTSEGAFVASNPRIQNVKTLWGLPIIESNAMPVGKFLVGSFAMASQFIRRRGVMIEMSDSHNDNFSKDIVTLKASSRGVTTILRPASLVGGDLVTP